MCGIIGILGKTNSEEIQSLLDPIRHRGMVHDEMLVFKNGGMGTNRLPIIDSEYGKQPVANSTKSIFAVMNGEIFNHEFLRKDLIQKGHSFKTHCDTELIPHLYEEYGIDFFKYIDSEMYTIIIFDQRKNHWIVVRDLLGVKPLYYAQNNEKIYFASEAKQLAKIENVKIINIFPAGHVFINGDFVNYQTFNEKPLLSPDASVIKKIRNLFDQAVEKRIPIDDIVGVLLSGGIDSAAVLVTLLKYSKNVIAFIVGAKDSSDRKAAVKLCDELKVNYNVIEPHNPTIEDIKEVIKTVETNEKNTVRHSWVAYLACQQAKKHHLKVLLCGEGADELFGGYDAFAQITDLLNHRARKLMLENLNLTQLPRVDRTGMRFTLEIRCPFLDKKIVDLALNLKTTNIDYQMTKEVFREAMRDRLPQWIVLREKMPFSTGAGFIVDDENSIFKKIINTVNMEEQEFIDQVHNSFQYNKIIKKEAINKDNLLNALKNKNLFEH